MSAHHYNIPLVHYNLTMSAALSTFLSRARRNLVQSLSENEASSSAVNFSDEFLLQGSPASRDRSCDINSLSAIL